METGNSILSETKADICSPKTQFPKVVEGSMITKQFLSTAGRSEIRSFSGEGVKGMKKLVKSVMAAAMVLTIFGGCGTMYTKDTKVKCPKCGAVFTIDEGRRALEGGP